jgi:DNA invertase Pin-like site-specific DNA recombinase
VNARVQQQARTPPKPGPELAPGGTADCPRGAQLARPAAGPRDARLHGAALRRRLQPAAKTTTSGGKLVFHIFGTFAEFEREIIRERTQAVLQSARSRGKVGGRPKALTLKEEQMLRNMPADKSLTVSDICKTLGIGRTTFYRYVKAEERE